MWKCKPRYGGVSRHLGPVLLSRRQAPRIECFVGCIHASEGKEKNSTHVDHFRSVFVCLQQQRVETKDFASPDELRLSMQPPRPSPKPTWLQSPSLKPDASPSRSMKRGLDRVKSFSNGVSSQRLSHLGAPDRASREHNVAPILTRPAADEGSRTGLQGPGIGSLINGTIGAPSAGGAPGPDLTRRAKVTRSTGSDGPPPSRSYSPTDYRSWNFLPCPAATLSASFVPRHSHLAAVRVLCSRPVTAPASKQLTIFYGGQAHVFDDVPPDKVSTFFLVHSSE